MTILNRYEHILVHAVEEIGPVDLPHDEETALALQADLAPRLADVLYRLTIEYGVPFGPFKETIISILLDEEPALINPLGDANPRPFGSAFEELESLILLALEMMPTESFDCF